MVPYLKWTVAGASTVPLSVAAVAVTPVAGWVEGAATAAAVSRVASNIRISFA